MELMLIFLMFWFALGGLILVGILHRQRLLERRLAEAIRQFNVVAISRGQR